MTETKLTGLVNKVDKSIDRLKTCPLLLRVFCNKNHHHSPKEYEQGHTSGNELQIYTWMDATLGELTQLIKEVNSDARRCGTQFSFSIVSPDNSYNRYYLTDIGKTENGQKRIDDQIQLIDKHFHIGDYLDVAIMYKKPEKISTNSRRSQQLSEENNKKCIGKERHTTGSIRSIPRNDHPY